MEGELSGTPLWHISLFGGLRLERGGEVVTRFRSQNIAGLLAYLTLNTGQSHAREQLADLFWPDATPTVARTNLRTALASLRRQMEPPGLPAGSVLVSRGQHTVALSADTVSVDVHEFDKAIRLAARPATSPDERRQRLRDAVALYHGPLLPGFYETWALNERNRLEEMRNTALRGLIEIEEQAGDFLSALNYARQTVAADPTAEEGHATVIRLLMATHQERAARLQFQELTRLLKQEFGKEPAPEIGALLRPISRPVLSGKLSVPSGERETLGLPSRGALAIAVSAPPTPTPVMLPLTLTRFFGREQEVSQIIESLHGGDVRLLTLTGPGGTGKTRLATEAARLMIADFPGGVWFVPLADLFDASRFFHVVGKALGLPPLPNANPEKRVLEALEERSAIGPVLLVLDNFEQIVESGARYVSTLLSRVRTLSCLVTSRQRLLLEGEQEIPVRPLPTPIHGGTPELLLEFPSVQLFVSRAQAARADFQLTVRNADTVSALCARLEGVPLAIELSAAWSQTLTPAQMLARLNRRFDLLVSRRRDISERHSTLRATIDWSYQLLPPELQSFFARLSVFRGGWTLEAAEAISDTLQAITFLAELCERSLIVSEETHSAAMRYRMLESVREFAAERLSETDTAPAWQRYRDFFLTLAEAGAAQMSGPQQAQWLNRHDDDHDNLHAVLDFFAESESAEDKNIHLRLASSLSRFWMVRGYLTEGRQYLAVALDKSESAPGHLRTLALGAAGSLAGAQGDRAAAQHYLEACRDQSREIGNTAGLSQALSGLGNLALNRGSFAEAKTLYNEALLLYQLSGDTRGAARTLMMLGNVANNEADFATARRFYEESLALSWEIEDQGGIALVYQNLGVITARAGNPNEARSWYEKSLALRRELNDLPGLAATLETLGTVARKQGDLDTATRCYEESLALRRRIQDRTGTMLLRLNLALAAIDRADAADAASQVWESLLLIRESGNERYLPYVLETSASIASLRKEPERAAILWGAAESLRAAIHAPSTAPEIAERAVQMKAVAQTLPHGRFSVALAVGRALSQDEALGIITAPSS